MNNDCKADSKRRLLLGVAAGSAAAGSLQRKWVRPAVDSVLLPAHAVTTGSGGEPGGGVPTRTATTTTTTTTPDPCLHTYRDTITLEMSATKSASAGLPGVTVALPTFDGDLCIQTSDCGATWTAKLLLNPDGELFYEASGVVNGGSVPFIQTGGDSCEYVLDMKVYTTTPTESNYGITGDLYNQGDLPPGEGCPSPRNSIVCNA